MIIPYASVCHSSCHSGWYEKEMAGYCSEDRATYAAAVTSSVASTSPSQKALLAIL
jgi:hypothetical protein